tara:strand:+ start:44 stop:445 length:402 start_codon:yes stop_codon:yes gene_type:complete
MGTKLKLTEDELIELIEKSIKKKINEQPEDLDMLDVEEFEDEIEDEEDDDLGEILTPEEIIGLMSDQIEQLQERTQYVEELNADVLELLETVVGELTEDEKDTRKFRNSRRLLNQLQTRFGRNIFWIKSRRLN